MTIPLKYEDVVAKLDAALGREAALRGELDQCGSMAGMIEDKEWAEHAGSGPVSSSVESAFTQLHNELSELRESYESMRDRKNSIVDLQQRLTVAEQRESEAREELLDLSRKLDVFYSRSHGIKNLSAIEDANDKSKALQQRLTVAERRAEELEGLLFGDILEAMDDFGDRHGIKRCREIAKDIRALKPAAEGEGS